MSFWSEATEPLRKNRWNIIFTNSDLVKNIYTLKKVDKPSYKTLDIQHKFGNYTWNYPGRVEWNPINITIVSVPESQDPGSQEALMRILNNAGFAAPTYEVSALLAASKKSFNDQIGSIEINQLDSSANSIETWKLINPFFTNIKFGELSYDSEEVVDIEVTVRYDTAELITNIISEN